MFLENLIKIFFLMKNEKKWNFDFGNFVFRFWDLLKKNSRFLQILRFVSKSSRFFRISVFQNFFKHFNIFSEFQIFILFSIFLRFSDFRFFGNVHFFSKFRDSSEFLIFQKFRILQPNKLKNRGYFLKFSIFFYHIWTIWFTIFSIFLF